MQKYVTMHRGLNVAYTRRGTIEIVQSRLAATSAIWVDEQGQASERQYAADA